MKFNFLQKKPMLSILNAQETAGFIEAHDIALHSYDLIQV
jgi:hypothetical protein